MTCATTGVNETSNVLGSALVYPNPANNAFTVLIDDNKNAKVNVSIINVLGKQVASFSNLDNRNGMIDCSGFDLANGLYIVKVSTGEKAFVSQLMIHK